MKLLPTALVGGFFSLAVIGGGSFLIWRNASTPGQYDDLAQCLTDKGVKMYGAYWCPHCQNQKKAFGKSFDKINYVECALPGVQGQTKRCDDADITGYPTWVMPDGEKLSGEQRPEELADAVDCSLSHQTPSGASQ